MLETDRTPTPPPPSGGHADNEKRWAREFAKEGVQVVTASPALVGQKRFAIMTVTTGDFLTFITLEEK